MAVLGIPLSGVNYSNVSEMYPSDVIAYANTFVPMQAGAPVGEGGGGEDTNPSHGYATSG